MVDLFVWLLGPGAGDELQGVKRGIVELADLIVVNKADGDLLDPARHTAADYAHALHLVRSTDDGAIDRVRTCSALLGEGIDELWETIGALVAPRASDELMRDALISGGRGCGRRSPTRCSTPVPTPRSAADEALRKTCRGGSRRRSSRAAACW
jgi:LAO/AO transport system kinase